MDARLSKLAELREELSSVWKGIEGTALESRFAEVIKFNCDPSVLNPFGITGEDVCRVVSPALSTRGVQVLKETLG